MPILLDKDAFCFSLVGVMVHPERDGLPIYHRTPCKQICTTQIPLKTILSRKMCHLHHYGEFIIYNMNVVNFLFRSTHDLVAMDGWLYAVGGNDGSSSLNSIEKYNPRSNKWVAASCMFTRRSSVGVAVLELLNFPPPSSPTLSVSSTSLWQRVKNRLSSSSLPCVAKRRNCSVWALVGEKQSMDHSTHKGR